MQAWIGPNEIISKRQQYFYPCTAHFYRTPPQLVKGDMQYLYDHEGRKYCDFFAGVSVVASGHCNPEIAAASVKQLETLQHTCTIYLTQPNVDLAERLAKVLPGSLTRTFFVNSGSEANEGALTLARMHTGRKEFIALEHGLHGRTYLTMSVTGLAMWRNDPELSQETGVHFIPRPYELGVAPEVAEKHSLDALEAILKERGDKIAAMIVEPIQGNAGIIVPPAHYFAKVSALLKKYDVLLIADEIQTGFGRTGSMFAISSFGVVPDIISMAKALGSGVPIAGFATTDEIAASYNRPSASTFGGNPVAAVTGLAVLDYIESHQLPQRASQLGQVLYQGLEVLAERFPELITEVRGAGLMIGCELMAHEPSRGAQLVDDILEEMKDNGFIIGKNGLNRNVLAFQPPLVIDVNDIKEMLQALEQTLSQLLPQFKK